MKAALPLTFLTLLLFVVSGMAQSPCSTVIIIEASLPGAVCQLADGYVQLTATPPGGTFSGAGISADGRVDAGLTILSRTFYYEAPDACATRDSITLGFTPNQLTFAQDFNTGMGAFACPPLGQQQIRFSGGTTSQTTELVVSQYVDPMLTNQFQLGRNQAGISVLSTSALPLTVAVEQVPVSVCQVHYDPIAMPLTSTAVPKVDCATGNVSLELPSSSIGQTRTTLYPAAAGRISGAAISEGWVPAAGEYLYEVVDQFGCKTTAEYETGFYSTPNLAAPTTNAGAGVTLNCTYDSIQLNGLSYSYPVIYNWSRLGGAFRGDSTVENPTTAVVPGTYILEVARASNGCFGPADTTFIARSTEDSIRQIELCPGEVFLFNGQLLEANGSVTSSLSIDRFGCDSSLTLVGVPVELSFSLSEVVDGAGNVVLTPSVTYTGTETLSYAWTTGETTPTLVNPLPGTYELEITNENGCRATQTFTVVDPSSSAVEALFHARLFPNPANTQVNWLTQGELIDRVLLLDLMGRTVIDLRLAGSDRGSIELAQLSPGVYFVQLWSGDQRAQQRLVVE